MNSGNPGLVCMTCPYPSLNNLFTRLLAETNSEGRFLAENFCHDERTPDSGRLLYDSCMQGVSTVASLADWKSRHADDYLEKELFIDPMDILLGRPWTFRQENADNLLHPHVALERRLVRLEDARGIIKRTGYAVDDLMSKIADFRDGEAKKRDSAEKWLSQFCGSWNEGRDLRPVFASYLDEVDDVLKDVEWADKIRDRLGMGHLKPTINAATGTEEFVPVLLLEYRVEETIDQKSNHQELMVPTVLDGNLNPCFFPTPRPGSGTPADEKPGGRTVNLNQVAAENDYHYGVELLHPKFDYLPAHIQRVGWIRRHPGLALERARKWHLPLVRTYLDREDFYPNDRNS
ncbi:MAG: hypothetical protein HQL65_13915 [Magnetococcales bacterium]|nr:hypothetical protein [Magnetococcales bacterium]